MKRTVKRIGWAILVLLLGWTILFLSLFLLAAREECELLETKKQLETREQLELEREAREAGERIVKQLAGVRGEEGEPLETKKQPEREGLTPSRTYPLVQKLEATLGRKATDQDVVVHYPPLAAIVLPWAWVCFAACIWFVVRLPRQQRNRVILAVLLVWTGLLVSQWITLCSNDDPLPFVLVAGLVMPWACFGAYWLISRRPEQPGQDGGKGHA